MSVEPTTSRGERAEGLADLGAEHRAADAAHHADAAGRPCGRLLGSRRRAIGPPSPASIVPIESTTFAGDRVDQLLPRRQGRLDPLGAAPGLRGRRRRAARSPSSSHRSASRTASCDRARSAAATRPVAAPRDGLPGDVAGEVPVHRAALVGQQLPELLERRAEVAGEPPPEQRRERVDRPAPAAPWTGSARRPRRRRRPGVRSRRGSRSRLASRRSADRWRRCTGLAGWAHHDSVSHRSRQDGCSDARASTRATPLARREFRPAARARTPIRSGRSPRRRRSSRVTGAASGLGARARRAAGRPARRSARSSAIDDRRGDGRRRHAGGSSTCATRRWPTPAARRSTPWSTWRLGHSTLGGDRPAQAALQRPRDARPCSPPPRPRVYAGWCCAPRRWSTARWPTTMCRSPRTRRCGPCPTAACVGDLLEIERLARRAPRAHPGLKVTVRPAGDARRAGRRQRADPALRGAAAAGRARLVARAGSSATSTTWSPRSSSRRSSRSRAW